MVEDADGGRALRDAAAVRAARLMVDAAIADLAVRPLDEKAAEQMRTVLRSVGPERAALRRLNAEIAARRRRRARFVVLEGDAGGDVA